jgi:diguanylate cyclase (GGDEF)-like protein
VLVRYGGEEFVVLLPETDTIGAVTIAARLRESLEAGPVVFPKDDGEDVEIPVRASIGVATWRQGLDPAGLIAEADTALYRAKALGRDRVELAT